MGWTKSSELVVSVGSCCGTTDYFTIKLPERRWTRLGSCEVPDIHTDRCKVLRALEQRFAHPTGITIRNQQVK